MFECFGRFLGFFFRAVSAACHVRVGLARRGRPDKVWKDFEILWLDGQDIGFDRGIRYRIVVDRLNLEAQLPKVMRDNATT